MMIDPKSFRMKFEDAGLDELLAKRDSIMEFMRDYENHTLPCGDYFIEPDPETIYLMNMEYLTEICDLIKIRMKKEDFYEKSFRIVSLKIVDDQLSKLDEDKQMEMLNELKKSDRELYDEFIEWKMNNERG